MTGALPSHADRSFSPTLSHYLQAPLKHDYKENFQKNKFSGRFKILLVPNSGQGFPYVRQMYDIFRKQTTEKLSSMGNVSLLSVSAVRVCPTCGLFCLFRYKCDGKQFYETFRLIIFWSKFFTCILFFLAVIYLIHLNSGQFFDFFDRPGFDFLEGGFF